MQKLFMFFAWLCFAKEAMAQAQNRDSILKNIFTDSLKAMEASGDMLYELPVVSLDVQDRNAGAYIPSLLSSNRDILTGMAAAHFSIMRFRLRGYNAVHSETLVNGISMNSPEEGNTQWGLWSGLNDVTVNSESHSGMQLNEWGFGSIGNNTFLDMRASKQRIRNQLTYGFSNRNFTHRLMYTRSGLLNKKWVYSVSVSYRGGRGYIEGTGLKGFSYYIGLDRQINNNHLLSLILFGSASETGKQAAVTEESILLAGSKYYNPNWGYQSGIKRNANTGGGHQPVLILSDERKIGEQSVLINSIGCIVGNKTNTSMDWYRAADPRPDYYRYLPSFQTDETLKKLVEEKWRSDEVVRQINWGYLYAINKKSYETIKEADGISGNDITGLRSHYILSQRVTGSLQINLNSRFQTSLNTTCTFFGGMNYVLQTTHQYKRINDLLGGDFFVDWNQFAAGDFPDNPNALQNDLNRPNRIVRTGDHYSYDYEVVTQKTGGWMQLMYNGRKLDVVAAIDLSYVNYQRTGFMRSGLFPDDSYGKSLPVEFVNPALKAGLLYKINGRKYFYIDVAVLSKAPLFSDIFISPENRDTRQENIRSEQIQSAEAGYILNSPRIKLRATGYCTKFLHGMRVTTFYHDGYGSFVNYALSGIDRLHFGMELGVELKLSARYTFNAAASSGRYYYNSRQQVTVSSDNDAAVLERTVIYSQNFRIPGTPQDAMVAGIRYQSPKGFYMSIAGSYFNQFWLDFNPIRRTYAAMQNVNPGTDQWNKLIRQIKLPGQTVLDLSAGSTVRSKLFQKKQKKTIAFYLSINNLLNNQQIISGGSEQMRFDADARNPDKFTPKLFYAMGLNFSTNISFRL